MAIFDKPIKFNRPGVRTYGGDKVFTFFSCGEPVMENKKVVKDMNGKDVYTNVQYIVWGEAIEIRDGDKVFVTDITGVSASQYQGSLQFTVSCHIKVEHVEFGVTNETEFIVPQSEIFKPVVENEFTSGTIDDVNLPFDL